MCKRSRAESLTQGSDCNPAERTAHLFAVNTGPSTVSLVKRTVLLAVFALTVAACQTGADSATSTSESQSPSTTGESTTTLGGDGETTTTTGGEETTTTASGRDVAPDFTLQLGDGGTYTLSEGAKPVYLVFWAEW